MSYDHWKTTNPDDEWLGPEPQLPCGCRGHCNPYAHDTAWDWDGTPDGPDYHRCPECDEKIYEGDSHECEFSAVYQDRLRNQ
jgi:hypothetical protein